MNSQNNKEPLLNQKDENKPTIKKAPFNKKKTKKVLLILLVVVLVLALAVVGTVFGLIQSGKISLLNTDDMNINPGDSVSDVQVEEDGKTVDYGGTRYVYNDNMTTVLCIGVDEESFSSAAGVNGLNGQADAVFLYALDTATGDSTIIPIPRDTMVDVDLYSSSGKYVSSSKKQLCLAYAYGDGKHKSCENTLKSVTRLFYGLPINSYVAIDLKSIEVLSEKVGGVPVTPSDTFTYGGYTFYAGNEVNLKGLRARAFIQWRDEARLETNFTRMSHQKQFITSFFNKALEKTKKDITFPVSVYKSASKYMITDINLAEISFFASSVVKSGSLSYHSIDGEMKIGEKYAEFYADDNSVYKTIIDVFYTPVQ